MCPILYDCTKYTYFHLSIQDQQNALHLAVCGGHFAVVKYLLPIFGPSKFDFDNHAQTCLHKAARDGYPKILRLLIEEHGFDPSLTDQVYTAVRTIKLTRRSRIGKNRFVS